MSWNSGLIATETSKKYLILHNNPSSKKPGELMTRLSLLKSKIEKGDDTSSVSEEYILLIGSFLSMAPATIPPKWKPNNRIILTEVLEVMAPPLLNDAALRMRDRVIKRVLAISDVRSLDEK